MRNRFSDYSGNTDLCSTASLSTFQLRSSFQQPSFKQKYDWRETGKKKSVDSYANLKPVSDQFKKLRQTLDIGSNAWIRNSVNCQELKPQKQEVAGKYKGFSRPNQYKREKVSQCTNSTLTSKIKQENQRQKQEGRSRNNNSINNRKNLETKLQCFNETLDKVKNQLEASTKISEELFKMKQDRRKRNQQKYQEILNSQSNFKSDPLEKARDISFKKKCVNQFYTPPLQKNKYDLQMNQSSNSLNLQKYKSIDAFKNNSEQLASISQANQAKPHYRSKSNFDNTFSNISLDIDRKARLSTKMNQLDRFIIGKSLGQGRFGQVFKAVHKQTGMIVALKKIPKAVIKQNFMVDQFILEVKLQSFLSHPNITQMYHLFDDKTHIYLVLEFMEEGPLFKQLKKTKTLKEKDVKNKIKQIGSAIHYLQHNEIAHRDIKPQNIVMSNGVCKLCDFGWATICKTRRSTYCGTFDYTPPQILVGDEYDFTVDIWGLGILTYELLVGKAPFYHISRQQTKSHILNVESRQINFPDQISSEARNFISCLLRRNPRERLSSEEVLRHPFLKGV